MSLSNFQGSVFTWLSSPIISSSFSASFAGSSSSARLFDKDSCPGPRLFHLTPSPGDQIYTHDFTCIFIFVTFIITNPAWTSRSPDHQKHIPHYLPNMPPNKIIDLLNPPNLPYCGKWSHTPPRWSDKKHKIRKEKTSKLHRWLSSPSFTPFTPLVSPVDSTTKNIFQFQLLPTNPSYNSRPSHCNLSSGALQWLPWLIVSPAHA